MKGSRFTEEQIIGRLRAEANAYVERHRGERDQQRHALVARNGEAQARSCATPTKSAPALPPAPPPSVPGQAPPHFHLGSSVHGSKRPGNLDQTIYETASSRECYRCRFFSYSCARDHAE